MADRDLLVSENIVQVSFSDLKVSWGESSSLTAGESRSWLGGDSANSFMVIAARHHRLDRIKQPTLGIELCPD